MSEQASAVAPAATTTNGAVPTNTTGSQGTAVQPMFLPSEGTSGESEAATSLDLDDLFRDCYFGDFPVPPFADPSATTVAAAAAPSPAAAAAAPVAAAAAPVPQPAQAPVAPPSLATSSALPETVASTIAPSASAAATHSVPKRKAEDIVERRERNREHAKRSRLRKKFLLESLQEQIHGLQSEIDQLTDVIKKELPDRAEEILKKIRGQHGEFTPLPMPSGFGPVKTLMEPDFRLMSALSGSQQNFAISDPSLPDNPIVYVSQGFLDLTGYRLDQVLGRNCRFLQGPGTDQSAVDVIRKGVREGVDTSVCLLNYKADGTPFWNQFFVAALRDAENNVVNFVGVQCEVSKAVVEKQMNEGKTPKSTIH